MKLKQQPQLVRIQGIIDLRLTYRFSVLISIGLALLLTSTALADETCHYPGFLGGPFPGTPACTEGLKTQLRTCDQCSWYPERDKRVVCADDSDCVELVGKYMACGGPIGPFVVDNQDNVYFWSSRWNLHSLDKRGNLRWRFDLCQPAADPLCQFDRGTCGGTYTRIPAMVMDYHGTLYFFIGDVLYAINSEGDLLLKHRVEIPGVTLADHWMMSIGSGAGDFGGGYWSSYGGSPVLHTDGTMSVAFAASGATTGDILPSGVIRISRAGEVLNKADYLWRNDPKALIINSNLLGGAGGELLLAGLSYPLPFDGASARVGRTHVLESYQPVWKTEQPKDFQTMGTIPDDYIAADLAVGPQGRVYGVSEHGAVYAFDLETKTLKRIFNIQRPSSMTWQNRPTVDPDGTLYLVTATRTGGYLWALDTEELWQNPVPERADYTYPPNPADYAGLKWGRVYGGDGGWSTAAISANGRIYSALGGIAAHDAQTGDQIWRFGERTMASAPTILSDGTIVVGQGITGRVFFLREDTSNGGHAQSGWPLPRHDRYMSNNARHPFRWDRSGEAPYKPLGEVLAQLPPCWNQADWDTEECGPLPEPRYRTEPPEDEPDAGGDAGDADVGQPEDVTQADDANPADVEDTAGSSGDVVDTAPSDLGDASQRHHDQSSDCAGCASAVPGGGKLGAVIAACVMGLLVLARRRRQQS